MAIQKGYRFPIKFADAFPQGLVLMGELAPDNDYQRGRIGGWAAGATEGYRDYGSASRAAASAVPGDPAVAWGMAEASRKVATAWREMERVPELPRWTQAALVAGAQAFEFQARDWNARADHAWPLDGGGLGRPPIRLSTRAKPNAWHEGGESDG